ncbi:MAG: ribonuclease HI [Alkalispirochaeta sp.]
MSGDSKITDIILFTDGGCHGNPGPGAWAWRAVSPDDSVLHDETGYAAQTTNNRMELMAVIEALTWVRDHSAADRIVIRTDSQYVRQGITAWIYRWKQNGWLTAGKKPVKNADLWRDLDRLNETVAPQWDWVRGHAGNEHNEACDEAVQREIRANRG